MVIKEQYDFVERIAQQKVTKLRPKKAALLIIDMQDFFLNEKSHAFIPNMPKIVPKLKKLQDYFLENNLVVFQTRHGNTMENAGQMLNWWGSILAENDPLSAIITELKDNRVPIIAKTQYDAFWQTDLEQKLRDKGVEQIIIGGVMTHLCCETTARAAFVRGFEVFFLIDGTATYNKQFHFDSLYNLAHGFASLILTKELIEYAGA